MSREQFTKLLPCRMRRRLDRGKNLHKMLGIIELGIQYRIWRSQAHGKGKKSPRTPTTPLAKMASKLNEESISLESVMAEFKLSNTTLRRMMSHLSDNMDRGLESGLERSTIAMLPSFVPELPNGKERGKFVAMDLGGTNLRVMLMELEPGEPMRTKQFNTRMPNAAMHGTGQKLFDYIAKALCDFLVERELADEHLPVGFTFSYPCDQTGLRSATLLRWTKGVTATFSMDSSEPSCSAHNFQPGDLIWAKMKGFPPWPAKVLERSEDAPARRIPVMFFGTLETSFMKPNDLSDYLPNRLIHEIPRKQKDFNKAVQEIRKAAGLQTDADEINFPTIERKSPPSSPTATGRKRQTSGRFLDAIMAGADPVKMRGTRSGSASTKTRSRASSNASASKLLRDMMRKERQRLNSESSTGSRRKLLNNALLGGGGAPSTSDAFGNDYADSTDFNALFGDAILGNFELNDDTKSWKSKRSRGSSKVFDDLFGRSRNRSGSASGRRSRMISLSGFSGVSDMFDELFNNPGDIDSHADQLMLTLNNMPSDGSIDRPLSPEMLNPILQAAVEFCDRCGYECRLTNGSWKCNSSHCGAIKTQGSASVAAARGIIDQPIRMPNLEIKTECLSDTSAEKSSLPAKRARKPKRNSDDDDSIDEEAARRANSINKKKKRVQVLSPRSRSHSPIPQITPSTSTGLLGRSNSPLSSSLRIRDRARPKHYGYSKVEKTPPISASGHRHCVNCNGQVRPQMCGGNRHRWRCVDKKCRKWYGWVRSHEEIPKNTGRKKMTTFKSPITKPMKLMKPKKEEEDDGYPSLKRKVGRPSKNDIKIRLKMQKEVEEKQAAVNAARASQMALDAAATSSVPQQRRKYTKRKKDGLGAGTGGKNRDYSPFEDDVKKRSTSPLNDRSASYRPCAMEKRARWWTGEKRRVDASPEREFGTTPADSAAAFRMMAHAVRSAAVTRADEVGTVNGSLDLLMDSLLGSIGPLLANLTKLPVFQGDQELAQQLWNASAVHIPTFQ